MKKKVLFMMPALPGGGAEKVLIDILKNFDYASYEVILFLEYKEGVYLNDVPEEVRILALHSQNTIWFERFHRVLRIFHSYVLFHTLIYKYMFMKLLKGERFNTIVSFMEGAAVKFHSYIIHKANNNLSWVHIDLKQKHWSLDFFRNEKDEFKVYRKMDKIVFVSEDVKRMFLELYAIENDKCKVIYNLIDKNVIQRLAISNNAIKRKFTICMVGRLNRQKRYDRALKVAKRLKSDGCDFDLWIIGEGSLEKSLKAMSHEYGMDDCVHFLGFQKPSYPYMKEADIYLNTSEAEGYPLVVCEALCLGLAIVATDISGASEILASSEYGLLVSEKEEDIYNGLKRLMDDAALYGDYRAKALQRAEMFDVPTTMAQIYKVL